MDDTQNPQSNTKTDPSIQTDSNQPIDPAELEALNEVKALENEEHTEAQTDADIINKREALGEALEKEEHNPQPPLPNDTTPTK